jgi:hypothetical protein
MAPRLELQALLKSLLGSDKVYFQPPTNTQLQYPCIIYTKDDESTEHANNVPYTRKIRYQVTVIDADPDSLIPDKIAALPLCSFDRFYTSDRLNHNTYQLFF